MSLSGSAEAIEIDVVLRASVTSEDATTESQGPGNLNESDAEDLAQDLLDTEDFQSLSDKLKNFDDILGNLDQNALKKLKSFAGNPGGVVEGELLGILGRAGVHGAVAVSIIGIVLSAPETFKAIVKFLGQKGGPLNQDYHRDFDDEVQLGIDRDLQFRRAAGLDVVITNQDRDFILSDPAFTTNSLVDVEFTRFQRITSNQVQWGYADST